MDCEPLNWGLRGAKLPKKMFRIDKSTGLEYFSNDKSIKRDIKWKLRLKKYHI